MGKRFFKFIVACGLAALPAESYGQEQPKNIVKVTPIMDRQPVLQAAKQKTASQIVKVEVRKAEFLQLSGRIPPLPLQSTFASNGYTRNFGFFCRKELQLEKSTRIPFRFRLGSLAYCDYLEMKGGRSAVSYQ